MTTSAAERVEFFISCQDLTSQHTFVACFLKDAASSHFLEIGRSEISYNGNPKFTKQFLIDFIFEEEQQLRFDIYKSLNGSFTTTKKTLLGSCAIKLSEVIHSKCQMLTRTLTNGRKVVKNRSTKRYSRLSIRLEPVSSDVNENIEFQFSAQGLPKHGAIFGTCNPVLEMHRLGNDGKYFKVFETEKLLKSLDPQWKSFQITSQALCNNDVNRKLQFKIFHAERDIRKYVGKIQTSYYSLKIENRRQFDLKNTKGRTCGKLQCMQLKVLSTTGGSTLPALAGGASGSNISHNNNNNNNNNNSSNKNNNSSSEFTRSNTASYAANIAAKAKHAQEVKRAQTQRQTHTQKVVRSMQEARSQRSQGQFLQYLRGACEISLMISVDFTGSNGYVNDPKSLHYIFGGQPSPYQQALRTICPIVAQYDSDQQFPIWGFGAKFPHTPHVVHDFALSQNGEEVDGVAGVEQAYVSAINSNSFQLSGPTYFSPILAKALNMCVAAHNKVVKDTTHTLPVQYFIYLLLTNGNICEEDKQQTKDHIVYAANKNLPLSIIIVGVGDGEFEFLNELDADYTPIKNKDGEAAKRDIVQFVQMNKFDGKPLSELSKYTLREVPIQFMSYVKANGIKPRTEQVIENAATSGFNEVEEEEHDARFNILQNSDSMLSVLSATDDEEKDNASDTCSPTSNQNNNNCNNNNCQAKKIDPMANAPVPPGWEKSFTASGRPFYIDHKTRKTQWKHPLKKQMMMVKQPSARVEVEQNKHIMHVMNQPAMTSNPAPNPIPTADNYGQPRAQNLHQQPMQPGQTLVNNRSLQPQTSFMGHSKRATSDTLNTINRAGAAVGNAVLQRFNTMQINQNRNPNQNQPRPVVNNRPLVHMSSQRMLPQAVMAAPQRAGPRPVMYAPAASAQAGAQGVYMPNPNVRYVPANMSQVPMMAGRGQPMRMVQQQRQPQQVIYQLPNGQRVMGYAQPAQGMQQRPQQPQPQQRYPVQYGQQQQQQQQQQQYRR